MNTLSVATWNILYDKQGFFNTEPQAARQDSITQTLGSVGVKLDITGLLEVENNQESGHHGQNIARVLTATNGSWTTNIGAGEDIGLFGKEVGTISVFDLAGGRTMVVTHVGEIAVGLVHFTFDMTSDRLRRVQAKQALAHMEQYNEAILMGDFNSASWQRSRKIIETSGFQSVFQALGRRRPPTILTEKYRQRLSMKYRIATKYGFSPDDIYIKDLEVLDAGVFEGDSDHRGIWASLKVS